MLPFTSRKQLFSLFLFSPDTTAHLDNHWESHRSITVVSDITVQVEPLTNSPVQSTKWRTTLTPRNAISVRQVFTVCNREFRWSAKKAFTVQLVRVKIYDPVRGERTAPNDNITVFLTVNRVPPESIVRSRTQLLTEVIATPDIGVHTV